MTQQVWVSREVCAFAQCTYRQLDYWVRMGAVTPSVSAAEGSGFSRLWSTRDAHVIRAITAASHEFDVRQFPLQLVEHIWREGHSNRNADRITLRLGSVTLTIDTREEASTMHTPVEPEPIEPEPDEPETPDE